MSCTHEPQDAGNGQPGADASSLEGGADLGVLGIRRGFWVLAILAALTAAAVAPWLPVLAPGSGFAYWFYVPVVPLSLLGVIALVWNPLIRHVPGLRALALRPREIVLLGAMLYTVAGVAQVGLSSAWRGMLMNHDQHARQDAMSRPLEEPSGREISIKDSFPAPLSYAARRDLLAIQESCQDLAGLLFDALRGRVDDAVAWRRQIRSKRQSLLALNVPHRYVMNQELADFLADVTATVNIDQAAPMIDLLIAWWQEVEPEHRLLEGLAGQEQSLSDLHADSRLGNLEAGITRVRQDLMNVIDGLTEGLPSADAMADAFGQPRLPDGFYETLQGHVSASEVPSRAALRAAFIAARNDSLRSDHAVLRLRQMAERTGFGLHRGDLREALGFEITQAHVLQAQWLILRAEQAGTTVGDDQWRAFLDELIRPLRRGETPISRVWGPILPTMVMVLLGIGLIMALVAFTARQWTHHERLQHPLVQVPMALAQSSYLRNRAFLMTVVVMVVFWIYQYAARNSWHPLPGISTNPIAAHSDLYRVFGIPTNVPARWVYTSYFSSFNIVPFAIGIAFLLAADVGFSVWGGWWFGCLIFGWLFGLGVQINYQFDSRLMGSGAALGMLVLIAWMGRHHYARLIKGAFQVKPEIEDEVGVWGARFLMGCSLGLMILLWSYIDGPWYHGLLTGLIGCLLFLTSVVVIARVVAETGLAAFQAPETIPKFGEGLGLQYYLPIQVVLMITWLSQVMANDSRENLAGFAVQSAAMGERSGLRPGRLLGILTGLAVAVALVSLFSGLVSNWTGGTEGRALGGGSYTGSFGRSPRYDILGLLTRQQFYIIVGFVLVMVVAAVRRNWARCPLHPLGIVVAASWPIYTIWSSLFLGWLAKILVLRYGGSHLYTRLKPVAIGLILGEMLGIGIQFLFQFYSQQAGLDWNVWRSWP